MGAREGLFECPSAAADAVAVQPTPCRSCPRPVRARHALERALLQCMQQPAWRTHMPMLQCASLRNLYRMRRLAVPMWLASPERRKRTSRCSMRRGHRHRRQPRQETFLRRCRVARHHTCPPRPPRADGAARHRGPVRRGRPHAAAVLRQRHPISTHPTYP